MDLQLDSTVPPAALSNAQYDITLREKTVLCAQGRKRPETFFLPFSKAEPQVLAVIPRTEFGIEFFFLCNQLIKLGQVFVTQGPQAARDCFRVLKFRANQPERINKGKTDEFFPLLAKIPKLKVAAALLAEANCLIADQQVRFCVQHAAGYGSFASSVRSSKTPLEPELAAQNA